MSKVRIAVIGSGATALYLLKQLHHHAGRFRPFIGSVAVFERSDVAGAGMPYHPRATDRYNLCNISSRELPDLGLAFSEWLLQQDSERLSGWGIVRETIDQDAVYPRVALGTYFVDRYDWIVRELSAMGLKVVTRLNCEVTDLCDDPASGVVKVETANGAVFDFERVFVCAGHHWKVNDVPRAGYYGSPWPIAKLLPSREEVYNCEIGTLGASLSAFDVVSSLSHRHGAFAKNDQGLSFTPRRNCGDFKIRLHSVEGWLPQLQFQQREPRRVIYRHVSREAMLALRGVDGWLRLASYFDEVCRPALHAAFERDDRKDVAARLSDKAYSIDSFVQQMTADHAGSDPFAVMGAELRQAHRLERQHRPVHWKEVFDDLMYTLNFHAEFMPAEDHRTLHSVIMPFLLNVMAALPLESARILLALHQAGRVEIAPGRVTSVVKDEAGGETGVTVQNGETVSTRAYPMFIDCSGQKSLSLEEYPFRTLVEQGAVREARVGFARDSWESSRRSNGKMGINGEMHGYEVGGIDIDGVYRVISQCGRPNPRIHELSFPRTSGMRPYSYGLQSCSDTAAIAAVSLLKALEERQPRRGDAEAVTKIYEET